MQDFLQKSPVRELMDEAGFLMLSGALSMAWFIFLWGVTLPALFSGAALWALIILLRRKSRDGRLKRREASLRRAIGGELALEELLLLPPQRAHTEAAALLALRRPLTLLRASDAGVLCRLRGETVLLCFCQLPVSCAVGAQQVLSLQRAAREMNAPRGILCAPCEISPAAAAQAGGDIPVSFLGRDSLISLFGSARPATDRQLVALGKRRKRHPASWLPMILNPRRALRYLGYCALLMGMHLLTGLTYYAVPGIICLLLSAACRCLQPREEIL